MPKLNDVDLPNSMRYSPFVQDKRYTVSPTITGAVVQFPAAGIIHGDGQLTWTMQLLCFSELCAMYQLYQLNGPLVFEGQYGERLMVDFVSMVPEAIGGGNYNIQGTFIVRCVLNDLCEGE